MSEYRDPLHIDPETYRVVHPSKSYYLNKRLIDRQNCWTNVSNIVELHKKKLDIWDEMENCNPKTEKQRLKDLAKVVEEIEFDMQEQWKFDKDAKMHRPWDVPHCDCPKMDNNDMYGTGKMFISSVCPIHGN